MGNPCVVGELTTLASASDPNIWCITVREGSGEAAIAWSDVSPGPVVGAHLQHLWFPPHGAELGGHLGTITAAEGG